MANWKKVIVSGSTAELNSISASGNIVPVTDAGSSLGAAGQEFQDLFIDGTANIDALVADTANIDGGTIDGVTLGGSSEVVVSGSMSGSFQGDGTNLDLSNNSTIGSEIFKTIAVSGQDNLVADSNADTLTFASSSDGLKITTTAASDTLTFDLVDIPNSSLANSSITVTAGDGLKTGGSVSLGGSVTVDVDVSDFAGTGLEDEGSENLGVSAAQTSITSIINSGMGKIGTAADQEYITFGTSNEVNTFVNNTERLSVTNTGVDVTGNLTVSSNATIEGDLVVNGSTTTLATTNLSVEDRFIFTATGSAASNVDGGLIVQSGSKVDSGSAIYHDINSERWAVAKGVASTGLVVTPLQFVGTVKLSTDSPSSTDADYGVGEMWIETDTEEIYIRTS